MWNVGILILFGSNIIWSVEVIEVTTIFDTTTTKNNIYKQFKNSLC